MNWEKLIPNSTVSWGFIHINTGFFGAGLTEYYNMDSDSGYTRLHYPYIDRCYNTYANMKEIQSVMYDENLEIMQTRKMSIIFERLAERGKPLLYRISPKDWMKAYYAG